MDRTKAGAGQHRDRRFGHHRHIDPDPIALGDAEPSEAAGEQGYGLAQLAIGEFLDLSGDRTVPEERHALATAGRDMAVERIPASVEPAPGNQR